MILISAQHQFQNQNHIPHSLSDLHWAAIVRANVGGSESDSGGIDSPYKVGHSDAPLFSSISTISTQNLFLLSTTLKDHRSHTAMREPATVLWGLSISDADFKKLKAGFRSSGMNDKWNILAMDQSQCDNIPIHFSRSWTGIELHILYIKPGDGGSSSSAKIEAITWEQKRNGICVSEEYAKKEAVLLARGWLECDFEALPKYDRSDL